MNRDDCEKLLDAFENAVIATRLGTSESIPLAKAAKDSLHDVIVGIMAGSAGTWRDGTAPHATWWGSTDPCVTVNDGVYRGAAPLTVETDVANMPSIPNMNSLLREHEEEKCN